ncbi:MAG: FtsH protease activity modulator HflK [Buchnera aphidicola (Nurudea yanoniella)]
MVWNRPNNNEPELDPWSNKNRNSEKFKNKKCNFFTFIELKKFFDSFKITNKFSHNNFVLFKYIKSPIILIFITVFFSLVINGFYTIKEAERGVVTRFGKFSHLVGPGLNWKLVFVDKVVPIDVKTVKELATSGVMLTSDENVVRVEMNVQYRITNPVQYLFSVTNPDDSLREATDSALRGVIGHSTMSRILTEGRTIIRSDTQQEIEETINPYKMGITILDVNFQTARPPEEVKSAFDDAIAARENREQYIREAEAYVNEVRPKANGTAQRILEEARAYKSRVISEAKGEVIRFLKILPWYKFAKKITIERLYIESMEKIFSNVKKILINDNTLLVSLDGSIVKRNELSKPSNFIDKNSSLSHTSISKKEDNEGFSSNISKKR